MAAAHQHRRPRAAHRRALRARLPVTLRARGRRQWQRNRLRRAAEAAVGHAIAGARRAVRGIPRMARHAPLPRADGAARPHAGPPPLARARPCLRAPSRRTHRPGAPERPPRRRLRALRGPSHRPTPSPGTPPRTRPPLLMLLTDRTTQPPPQDGRPPERERLGLGSVVRFFLWVAGIEIDHLKQRADALHYATGGFFLLLYFIYCTTAVVLNVEPGLDGLPGAPRFALSALLGALVASAVIAVDRSILAAPLVGKEIPKELLQHVDPQADTAYAFLPRMSRLPWGQILPRIVVAVLLAFFLTHSIETRWFDSEIVTTMAAKDIARDEQRIRTLEADIAAEVAQHAARVSNAERREAYYTGEARKARFGADPKGHVCGPVCTQREAAAEDARRELNRLAQEKPGVNAGRDAELIELRRQIAGL